MTGPGSLTGMRVLIPRGGQWGADTAAAVRAAGGSAQIAPLVDFTAADNDAPLTDALSQLAAGEFDWLVLTSATAISSIINAGAVVPTATKVAVVGPMTAKAATEAGLRVDLAPDADASAGALLAQWPASASSASILLPQGQLASAELADGLVARGHTVHRVEAYRTVSIQATDALRDQVAAGEFDVVFVGSGSISARLAAEFSPLPASLRVVCLGQRTAADARTAGLTVAATAAEQSIAGLIAAAATLRVGTAATLRTGPTPVVRPRRLRGSEPWRQLAAETRIAPRQLVLPMFIREGMDEPVPIGSMPGVLQHSLDSFREALHGAAEAGIGGVMLFGVPEHKDADGSGADDPDGILNVATRIAAEEVGDRLVVQTDLCLDEFTDHGHCGVLDAKGRVDNDATLARYRSMALAQADAGSALLGLSGMMDGQVAAVRDVLDTAGFHDVAILAYAAKYASALYGPFREAVDSSLNGHRRSYQLNPANGREGRREAALDIEEGADIVMVKPASLYLDVLASVAATSSVPVWAYQVSGEYAMIEAAAERGWIDRERAIDESLISIIRAGADAVLTYWAVEAAERNR